MTNQSRILSRKEFLYAASASAAGILFSFATPNTAFANADQNASTSFPRVDSSRFRIVSEDEIDRMWTDEVSRARESGAEIVLNSPHPTGIPIAPYSSVSSTVQANITVGGVPDIVYLLAVYENKENGTRISKVYNKYAYGFHSSCENGTYSHVIGDGGRTLIINATVTLRNTVGFAQSFKLHGEFGPTGGNYLSVAYI